MMSDNCSRGGKENNSNGNASDNNIKIYVRVRPPDSYANEIDHRPCLEVTSKTSLTLFSKPDPKVFTFDQVADPNTTQEEVFTNVAKKIIDGCLEGYNGTIFAYGQTGSGKTFTMLGPVEEDSFNHELRGVIPRGFEYLFNLMNREKEKFGDKKEFLCKCSFLEIYNEQVFDLLDPTSSGLHLREDIKKGVFVDGLLEKPVSSARSVYEVLNSGWLNRRVASTSMNRESSRSHAVFTITIESKEVKGNINNIKVSCLHLVDLAGSERQKDTHTQGVRLKEAGSINRSLSALGNVIMALVDITHGKQRHIHYRDSKLTFLLRDSLGGNARTHIIANVHPSARCFGETLSTLNFARRAKQIKNKAVVNEDTSGNIASLQEEIRRLKEMLHEARSLTSVPLLSNAAGLAGTEMTAPSSSGGLGSSVAVKQVNGGNESEWKEMMLTAVDLKEKAEQEKQHLEEKVEQLEELCKKKEKFLQSTKMILKFRDSHIAKLERMLKKNNQPVTNDDKEIELLKEEIKILAEKIDHHPDVTKFAMENLELRAELKKLRAGDALHNDLSYDLSKSRYYAMQLERQLRDALKTPGSGDLQKSLSSSLQSLEASNAELERYKSELSQLQQHLDSVKEELYQTRSELQQSKEKLVEKDDSFRKKLLESDAEIEASKRTLIELERTLETLQLKTAIERTQLNDVHMQTIKTLSSPRKFSTPNKKRLTNTSFVTHNNSGILDELPPNSVVANNNRRDSYNDLNDPDLEEQFFDFDGENPDDEELYAESLTEEIKKLQDMFNTTLQEKQNEEAQKIKLNQAKLKLEHQVQQLTEFLSSERASWTTNETGLNDKVLTLTDELKERKSEMTILKSENEDLKICLQQADRQIDSLKKDRDADSINSGRKIAALESKLCSLEIDITNTKHETEEVIELNQNFQADVENMRDELQFKDHKLAEWENLLLFEREKVKELEQELQSCMETLQTQTEANEKLIAEADNKQQLIAALEQCVNLKTELQRANVAGENQAKKITTLNAKLEESGELVAELRRQVDEEKDYRNKLLESVKESKSSLTEKESRIASLNVLIEESKAQNQELSSNLDIKLSVIEKLKEKLTSIDEEREKKTSCHKNEISALKEELQTTSDYCRELTRTLEEQQLQYGTLQSELKEKKEELLELNKKLTEIAAFGNDIPPPSEKLDSCSGVFSPLGSSVFDQSYTQVVDMKKREAKLQKVLESYEATFQQQTQELENYKTKMKVLEEKVCFEEVAKRLEIELENMKTESNERETMNTFQMKLLEDRVSNAMAACDSANTLKSEAIQVKLDTEQKLAEMTSKAEIAEEDSTMNYETIMRLTEKLEEYHQKEDDWKERFGREMEEKRKMEKSFKLLETKYEKVSEANAQLAGHQNINQKIQYMSQIKKELQLFKEENQRLVLENQNLRSCNTDTARKPLSVKNADPRPVKT